MPVYTAEAPARVNLIGEHTDYTGGLVLPMAISFGTTATITPADGNGYLFSSDAFATTRTLPAGDRSAAAGEWSDYPVGVLREFQALGVTPPPFHLHLSGNVPFGAGLSSSASVEVATAMALLELMRSDMTAAEVALLCRRAENVYVGSKCGIMDQFVIAAATAGHALMLNTRDLGYELLPMNTGGLAACSVVVANSMVKHSVAEGEYGVRFREVKNGEAAVLARYPALRDLGDATPEQLASCKADMDAESYLRCRHIVTENARVREARAAMLAGDAVALGEVMSRAHASYRDDFQASCAEADFLVDTATTLPGCHGARLTGGGFGGCTVNLVDSSRATEFGHALLQAYRTRYGIEAEIYVCEAVDGAVARAAAQARAAGAAPPDATSAGGHAVAA